MKIAGLKIITTVALVGALAGCDNSQGIGRFIAGEPNADSGPDEFGIVPTKPLELPDDFAALPEPTPAGATLRIHTQRKTPSQRSVAGQNGLIARALAQEKPRCWLRLNAMARLRIFRTVLAEEDKEFRKQNGPKLLERWFNVNTYLKSYDDETLPARLYKRIAATQRCENTDCFSRGIPLTVIPLTIVLSGVECNAQQSTVLSTMN